MADYIYSRYLMPEKMKSVALLILGIFLVKRMPGNLKPSETKSVLTKMEGVENLHELHVWSISSKDLALSCHLMIKDQSTHSAQNILNQIQSQPEERFNIKHHITQLECGCCATQSAKCIFTQTRT